MRFNNKTVIITGAASGIGKSTALYFANEGANIVITDINFQQLQDVKESIEKINPNIIAIQHNVANEDEWKKVITQTLDKFGELTNLVNNAGIFSFGSVENESLQNMQHLFSINVYGMFLGMKTVIPVMKKNDKPCAIVNVSSVLGPYVATEDSISYNSAKAAIFGMTKSSAIDVAGFNIRINSVHPGTILTPINASKLETDVEFKQKKLSKIPLGRVGYPEEVAKAIGFLCSDDASYIHGTSLVIDGGQILGYISNN